MNTMLKNADALNIAQAVSTYRKSTTGNNELMLHWKSTDPALVLRADHAPGAIAVSKKEFQQAHQHLGGEHIATLYGLAQSDYEASIRTVGVGTNLYLILKDGIFQTAVRRTPPSTTPEGVVNAGAFSRAAGGANGSILKTGIRELIEECHIAVVNGPFDVTSIDFVFDQPNVSSDYAQGLNEQKARRGILNDLLANEDLRITRIDVAVNNLIVPGLTETVWQKNDGDAEIALHDRVVYEDTKTGDMGGIDTIGYIDLKNIYSSQIIVRDGETDLNGHNLNRNWILERPGSFEAALKDGSMRFSGAPAKVIDRTRDVMAAFDKLGL